MIYETKMGKRPFEVKLVGASGSQTKVMLKIFNQEKQIIVEMLCKLKNKKIVNYFFRKFFGIVFYKVLM